MIVGKFLIFLICCCPIIFGQSVLDGNEFKINNSNLDDLNRNVSITSIDDGCFIVCWPYTRISDNGRSYSLVCQMYNSEGKKVGSPLEIQTESTSMIFPEVTKLSNNQIVLCWSTDNIDNKRAIWYQKFVYTVNELSELGGSMLVSEDLTHEIDIASKGDIFMICWRGNRGGDKRWQGILAKVYNADGTEISTNEIRLNVDAGLQSFPKVESLLDKFIVIWTAPDQSEDGVWAQFINFNGEKIGENFQINTYQQYDQQATSIAQLKNGNFIVTYNGWEGTLSGGTELSYYYDVFGQIFDKDGNRVGDEFVINSDTLNNQYGSRVEAVGANFVVVWHTRQGAVRIRGQLFDIYGNKINNEFTVSFPIEGSHHDEYSEIVSIKDAGYVVCWTRCKMSEWTGNTWGRYFNLDSTSTSAQNNLNEKIIEFRLENNYPNPFNPSTTISYSLPKNGLVQLKVYDVLGCEVASLVNKEQAMGNYKVEFTASNLTSGVYFYRLHSGDFVQTKKLILLR